MPLLRPLGDFQRGAASSICGKTPRLAHDGEQLSRDRLEARIGAGRTPVLTFYARVLVSPL